MATIGVLARGTAAAPGAWFACEYDLNIPWWHDIGVEGHLAAALGKVHPVCTGGSGACPPEDCGRPESYLAGLGAAVPLDAADNLRTGGNPEP